MTSTNTDNDSNQTQMEKDVNDVVARLKHLADTDSLEDFLERHQDVCAAIKQSFASSQSDETENTNAHDNQ